MIETQAPTRSHTFSWSDPAVVAGQVGGRPGLELLLAMISGEIAPPPFMQMLGLERMEAAPGRVTVEMTPREYHYNPLGTVHGGVLATLLDTAAGCAVHTTLPAGFGYASLDLTTKFLRPVTVASGILRCEGSIISRGRTVALAQARLTDGSDRLVAHATSSCLLFEAGADPAAEGVGRP